MASGRLGAVDLSAAVNTTVFTGTASKITTANITVCNRNSSPILIRLAHIDGLLAAIANEDYFEYDLEVGANDSYEKTGVVVAAGHTIAAYSDTANVSVQAAGWEEDV